MKQIAYVIINDADEMFAGVTTDHIWWSNLIVNTMLFENKYLAEKTNDELELRGTVKQMRYTLFHADFKTKEEIY
jgi:hypothetical protein